MKSYSTAILRNVGIVGHGDTGKTQLVSSLLFTAGMTTAARKGRRREHGHRLGRRRNRAENIDQDAAWPMPNGPAPGQAEKTKINFLDTPGYSTFINETRSSLIAADAALIVVDARRRRAGGDGKSLGLRTEYELPRAFVINWMDRELADFDRALESVQQVFGRGVVPLQLPIGAEKTFRGVDRSGLDEGAHLHAGWRRQGARSKRFPADMAEAAKAAHEALVEMVAEGDDELMEEFFEKGTLPVEDLTKGTARSVCQRKRIYPGGADLGAAQYRQRDAARFPGGHVPRPVGARQGHRP